MFVLYIVFFNIAYSNMNAHSYYFLGQQCIVTLTIIIAIHQQIICTYLLADDQLCINGYSLQIYFAVDFRWRMLMLLEGYYSMNMLVQTTDEWH